MQDLNISLPPSLNPSWIAFEQSSDLLSPQPASTPEERQPIYSAACKALNASMLAGPYCHLTKNLHISDSTVPMRDGHKLPIRCYLPVYSDASKFPAPGSQAPEASHTPTSTPRCNAHTDLNSFFSATREQNKKLTIYYHGGGLCVGDLDSEELSCRSLALACRHPVVSIAYRLMPDVPSGKCFEDAWDAFISIAAPVDLRKARESNTNEMLQPGPQSLQEDIAKPQIYLVGSSSGGQLATLVALQARNLQIVKGLLLRCPVLVDASRGERHVPEHLRSMHTSFKPAFNTVLSTTERPLLYSRAETSSFAVRFKNASFQEQCSLLNAMESEQENSIGWPLEMTEEVKELAELGKGEGRLRVWIQVCTNDVWYSDGVCFAMEMSGWKGGENVRVDVERGMPHTYWLKAPGLEEAKKAEERAGEGLKWVMGLEA